MCVLYKILNKKKRSNQTEPTQNKPNWDKQMSREGCEQIKLIRWTKEQGIQWVDKDMSREKEWVNEKKKLWVKTDDEFLNGAAKRAGSASNI